MTYPQKIDSTGCSPKYTIDCIEVFGIRKILGDAQKVVEVPDRNFLPGKGFFMALSNHAYDFEDLHPIDIVEDIATHQEWQFDRIADDQISMEMAGQWRSYSITLAWCAGDQTLSLICSFEMDPPAHRMPALYEALNAVNDMSWAGGFTYWGAERLMAYRYGLILSNGQMAMPDQIDTMISAAVTSAERYYPAFQMVTWGEKDLEMALKVAIAEAYGHA